MRFQLSRQIKAGLIIGLLINVLASPLSGTRVHDASLTPRVAGLATGKAGAGRSGAGDAVAGKSGSGDSGSTGPRLGTGTGSNPASGDKSGGVPRLGTGNTGESSSEVKTTVMTIEEITGKLPSGWKFEFDKPGKEGIKSELPFSGWLQERINLGDSEWVHWTMGQNKPMTDRMVFFTNPQLRAIIRYDAKLVENGVPLLSMKGRDIVMAAWAHDAKAANVPVGNLDMIVAYDLQNEHQGKIKEVFQNEKTDINTIGKYHATGEGSAGFNFLVTELAQGKGMDKTVSEYGTVLGQKKLDLIEAWLPTSKSTEKGTPANTYAIIGTLST